MKVRLTPLAAEDLAYWQGHNPKMGHRIEQLLQQLAQNTTMPRYQFTSLALSYPPLLSVKISPEDRVVFERLHDTIIVHQCRYHY